MAEWKENLHLSLPHEQAVIACQSAWEAMGWVVMDYSDMDNTGQQAFLVGDAFRASNGEMVTNSACSPVVLITLSQRSEREFDVLLQGKKNDVLFITMDVQTEVISLRRFIEQAERQLKTQERGSVKSKNISELESLAALYEKGLLSREEFDRGKAKLLGS